MPAKDLLDQKTSNGLGSLVGNSESLYPFSCKNQFPESVTGICRTSAPTLWKGSPMGIVTQPCHAPSLWRIPDKTAQHHYTFLSTNTSFSREPPSAWWVKSGCASWFAWRFVEWGAWLEVLWQFHMEKDVWHICQPPLDAHARLFPSVRLSLQD